MTGVFLNSAQANLFEQYLGEKPYKVAKHYFDGAKTMDDGRLLVSEQALNVLGSCLKNEPIVGMYSMYVAFVDALETRKREDRIQAERREAAERERERIQQQQRQELEKLDNIVEPEGINTESVGPIETVPEVSEVAKEETQKMETEKVEMENVD
jgi:hypothetical protein